MKEKGSTKKKFKIRLTTGGIFRYPSNIDIVSPSQTKNHCVYFLRTLWAFVIRYQKISSPLVCKLSILIRTNIENLPQKKKIFM